MASPRSQPPSTPPFARPPSALGGVAVRRGPTTRGRTWSWSSGLRSCRGLSTRALLPSALLVAFGSAGVPLAEPLPGLAHSVRPLRRSHARTSLASVPAQPSTERSPQKSAPLETLHVEGHLNAVAVQAQACWPWPLAGPPHGSWPHPRGVVIVRPTWGQCATSPTACASGSPFFLTRRERKVSQSSGPESHLAQTRTRAHGLRPGQPHTTYRASHTTSSPKGVGPSIPWPALTSSEDKASARAPLHASMDPHRKSQAWRTPCCRRGGSWRALALDNWRRKCRLSWDHLPPTSQPSTTRRARPCSPANSGYRRCFRRRAASKAAPSRSAH